MTHDITPDSHYTAGESVTWEFTINQNNSPKDISGASVSWYLLPGKGDSSSDAILSDSDSGVSASIVDASGGRVDVTIDQDKTSGEAGSKWHRLVVDDSGTGKQIWSGPFPINDP